MEIATFMNLLAENGPVTAIAIFLIWKEYKSGKALTGVVQELVGAVREVKEELKEIRRNGSN